MNVCPEQIGGRIEKYYQSTEKINENVYTGARLAGLILSPNFESSFPNYTTSLSALLRL